MNNDSDTIVALATPKGMSAIAVVRCSGDLSRDIISDLLHGKEIIPNNCVHTYYHSQNGDVIDDVMVVYFQHGHSYTGEDSMEIFCHGNMLIVDAILKDLCCRGCRMAVAGEYTKRAFLNHRMDLTQAEAVADLIHSDNVHARNVAQKQLSGGLSERINDISQNILTLLSKIEFDIDFSDDEMTSSSIDIDGLRSEIDNINECLLSLIASNRFRKSIDSHHNMVIIGAPNVGKSSLLNFLLDEDRAIVSSIAGTTRDVISDNIRFGDVVVNLCDTAGMRNVGTCEIEDIGIRKAIEHAEHADLFLIVVDGSNGIVPDFSGKVLKKVHPDNCLVVVNKHDCGHDNFADFLPAIDHISISLKDGYQLPLLRQKILDLCNRFSSMNDNVDIAVNARHVEILCRVQDSMNCANNGLLSEHGIEIVASDIRNALDLLGEITVPYDNEEMLDKVFSQFCVGK